MVNVLFGQHFAHVGTARRVADHGGAAANQGNGFVACHLQALHQGQGHKVAGGQAVGCAVKSDVESSLAVVDYFLDFFLVRYLGNQAAGFQFVINGHGVASSLVCAARAKNKTPLPNVEFGRGRSNTRYHLCLPVPRGGGPSRVRQPKCTTATPKRCNVRTRPSLTAFN